MTRHEMLTRFAEALTKAIGEQLEATALRDEHMDGATMSALLAVSHVIQHSIHYEYLVKEALQQEKKR